MTSGRVPALVVTLGTLYIFRGLAFLWTDGTQVNAETLPDGFLNLGNGLDRSACRSCVIIALDRAACSSASGCATTAPGASCTRSAPTPTAPAWPACARTAAC